MVSSKKLGFREEDLCDATLFGSDDEQDCIDTHESVDPAETDQADSIRRERRRLKPTGRG